MQLVEHIPCSDRRIFPNHRSHGDLGDNEEWNVDAIAPHAESGELACRHAMQLRDYTGARISRPAPVSKITCAGIVPPSVAGTSTMPSGLIVSGIWTGLLAASTGKATN